MRALSSVALVLAVCLLIPLGAMFQPPVQAQDSSLVGWWRFAERNTLTVADSSGRGNNGSLIGGALQGTDPVLTDALLLQENGAVFVPHNPNLEPATGTIEVWVKLDYLKDVDIIHKETDELVRSDYYGGFSVYSLRVLADGGIEGAIADDELTPKFGNGGYWATFVGTAPNLVRPGKWHHLALRWDGKSVEVFVDGKQRGSKRYGPVPVTGLSYHGTTPLVMAASTFWHGNADHEFSGRIGDVRIYSRPRSYMEINNDYALFDAGK